MVIIKHNATIIIRAKNIRHAIRLFDSKYGHDLQWALQHEGYTIEMENN